MAAIHTLPPEILDAISQHLSPNDLAAFARTAIHILPVAQRFLYKDISVSSISRNLAVVPTLARTPFLARHVRTFTVRLQASVLFNSFYRLLATALANMSGLTSLHLFLDHHASWIIASPESPRYPRLSHFACSFPCNSHVITFLSNAVALTEFEIDDTSDIHSPSIPPLSTASIPRLSQFIGSSRVANAVVPGRPVHTIHLLDGNITETDVVNLAKSSVPIIIFGATTSCLPASLLDAVARFMPHLAYLRIMTTSNFADPPHLEFYDQISRVLESLPNLCTFELAGMNWGPPGKFINSEGSLGPLPDNDDMPDVDDSFFREATFEQGILLLY